MTLTNFTEIQPSVFVCLNKEFSHSDKHLLISRIWKKVKKKLDRLIDAVVNILSERLLLFVYHSRFYSSLQFLCMKCA